MAAIVIGPTLRDRESSWMILSAALLLAAMDGRLSRTDGAILLLAYFPYFHATLTDARQQRSETIKTMSAHPWSDLLFLW